jgi:hypothetical protein
MHRSRATAHIDPTTRADVAHADALMVQEP